MQEKVTAFDAKMAARQQASWVNLAPFEPRRAELAATFARLGVASQTEADDARTHIHYLTVLFAFAEWARESGMRELELRSRDDDRPADFYSAAREKMVVGALSRLLLHPSLARVGASAPSSMMISMAANIGGVAASCRPVLNAILSAIEHAGEAVRRVAQRLAYGDPKAPSALTMDHFDSHVEFLDDLDGGGFMPPNACARASLDGAAAATFLHGLGDELPMSLADTLCGEELDEGALRVFLGQAGMYRKPLVIANEAARATQASFGAAVRGLATGRPPILLDASFQHGPKLFVWVPFVPFADGYSHLDSLSVFIKAFAAMPSVEFNSAMFPVV